MRTRTGFPPEGRPSYTLELSDRADEPQPKCQRCDVTLIVGPTAMDRERFGKRLCGGC